MEMTAVIALKAGMETAEDVLDHKGNVIIKKDTHLDDRLIQKLKFASITCIMIKEEEDYKTTYFEKIKVSKDFHRFCELYATNFNKYRIMMENYLFNGAIPDTTNLLSLVNNIIQPFEKCKMTVLDMLSVLETADRDFLYAHALNVALICSYTAKWFRLSAEDEQLLILSGFFYDVGKFKIPAEILTKRGKLTDSEFNTIKSHTLLGFQMLKDEAIDDRIKLVALMHHEKCDGTGYPQRLPGERIHPLAKIIAILDAYEAMTSYRSYRDPICPFKVIEIFERDGYGKYDTGYYMTFLERMVEEYIGKQVQLNDGTICNVVLINKQCFSRPMIKTEKGTYLDLANAKELHIETLI